MLSTTRSVDDIPYPNHQVGFVVRWHEDSSPVGFGFLHTLSPHAFDVKIRSMCQNGNSIHMLRNDSKESAGSLGPLVLTNLILACGSNEPNRIFCTSSERVLFHFICYVYCTNSILQVPAGVTRRVPQC